MQLLLLLLLITTLSFGQTLESLIPQSFEDENSIILNMGSSLQVSSSLIEKKVDSSSAPFNQALQKHFNQILLIHPSNNLIINLNQQRQIQESLKLETLDLWEQKGFSIEYSQNKSKLNFSQNNIEYYDPLIWDFTNNLSINKKIENTSFGFSQEIDNSIFSLSRQTTTTTQPYINKEKIQTDNFSANMPLSFGSISPTISYVNSRTTKNQKPIASNAQLQIEMPFSDKFMYIGNFSETLQNNQITKINNYSVTFEDLMSYQQEKTILNDQIHHDKRAFQIKAFLLNQPIEYKYDHNQNLNNKFNNIDLINYLSIPITIGNTQASFLFNDNKTISNDLLISQNKTEQIILSLFEKEFKYSFNSITSQNKGNIITNDNNEFIIHFNETVIYNMSDIKQYINNNLTTRDMNENIIIPLDKILGANLSYNKKITLITGNTQVNTETQTIFIPINFIINGASYQFITQNQSQNNQLSKNTKQHIIKIPFSNKANLNYLLAEENQEIIQKIDIFYPLIIFGIPLNETSYSHIILPDKNTDSRFFTNMQIPFSIFGKEIWNQNSISFSSLGQDKITSSILVPFNNEQIKLTHSTLSEPDIKTYTIETPTIPIINNTCLSANLWSQNSDQKHKININWDPLEQLGFAISMVSNDINSQKQRINTLDTFYKLDTQTEVNLRYLESKPLNNDENQTQSILSLQHNSEDIALKTTLINIDKANQDYEIFNNIEFLFNNDPFELSFCTINYDNKKLIPLEKAEYGIDAKYINEKTGVSIKYQDNQSKSDGFLNVNVFLGFGDQTNIKLGYTDNGLDPIDIKQKIIRKGQVFDIGLDTQILKDINVNINMRKYENNNWFNIGIAGGEKEKAGKLSFLYKSGDFVDRNIKTIPESTLSIQYDKQWSNLGNLLFVLSKDVVEIENIEAKVEFDIKF